MLSCITWPQNHQRVWYYKAKCRLKMCLGWDTDRKIKKEFEIFSLWLGVPTWSGSHLTQALLEIPIGSTLPSKTCGRLRESLHRSLPGRDSTGMEGGTSSKSSGLAQRGSTACIGPESQWCRLRRRAWRHTWRRTCTVAAEDPCSCCLDSCQLSRWSSMRYVGR